jgi:hypothetical protein
VIVAEHRDGWDLAAAPLPASASREYPSIKLQQGCCSFGRELRAAFAKQSIFKTSNGRSLIMMGPQMFSEELAHSVYPVEHDKMDVLPGSWPSLDLLRYDSAHSLIK